MSAAYKMIWREYASHKKHNCPREMLDAGWLLKLHLCTCLQPCLHWEPCSPLATWPEFHCCIDSTMLLRFRHIPASEQVCLPVCILLFSCKIFLTYLPCPIDFIFSLRYSCLHLLLKMSFITITHLNITWFKAPTYILRISCTGSLTFVHIG